MFRKCFSCGFRISRGLSINPVYIPVSPLFFTPRAVLRRFLLGVATAERSANRRVWLAASGAFSTGVCAPSTTRCVSHHAKHLARLALGVERVGITQHRTGRQFFDALAS